MRAREAAADDLRRNRQQLLSFLCGQSDLQRSGHWTARIGADWPVDARTRCAHCLSRRDRRDRRCAPTTARLEKQRTLIVPEWSMAPVVATGLTRMAARRLWSPTFARRCDVRRFVSRQRCPASGWSRRRARPTTSDGRASASRATGAGGADLVEAGLDQSAFASSD